MRSALFLISALEAFNIVAVADRAEADALAYDNPEAKVVDFLTLFDERVHNRAIDDSHQHK